MAETVALTMGELDRLQVMTQLAAPADAASGRGVARAERAPGAAAVPGVPA
jgi:hypothetical protein